MAYDFDLCIHYVVYISAHFQLQISCFSTYPRNFLDAIYLRYDLSRWHLFQANFEELLVEFERHHEQFLSQNIDDIQSSLENQKHFFSFLVENFNSKDYSILSLSTSVLFMLFSLTFSICPSIRTFFLHFCFHFSVFLFVCEKM